MMTYLSTPSHATMCACCGSRHASEEIYEVCRKIRMKDVKSKINSEICQQRRIYMEKYPQKQLNCAQQWCYVHMLQQHINMSKETYLYENRPRKGPIAPSMYRLQVPALAACCSTLQHVAVYCSMLQHLAIFCSMLQYVAVYWCEKWPTT